MLNKSFMTLFGVQIVPKNYNYPKKNLQKSFYVRADLFTHIIKHKYQSVLNLGASMESIQVEIRHTECNTSLYVTGWTLCYVGHN